MSPDSAAFLAKIREIALALPETEERPSHGQATFFAGGKMFAQFRDDHHGDDRTVIVVKVGDAETRTMLIEADPQLYSRPAYFRADWVSINLAPRAPDWEHVAGRLRQSWLLAAPPKLRATQAF
ncbi:MmcQ/YjbR family DNA-binding protein [Sphingomonas sp.]|uniref:MmcQ/YjbR family DNA-binding protein n=1 Tax=Sphingomonas sp. TaxID=28214 RepID=UPI001B2B3BCA|nr:MmcQ/YjbR family DNA-binding protein [Sphingomonas sp.]MBO9711872.1 MmcQ/YjbR family DNA-binding protein [Sphingomonas sp.]